MKAVNNFVFIIKDEEKKESGGLILPTSGRVKPHKGKVVSVGSLVKDTNIKSSKGKDVLFYQTCGFGIEYEKESYWVLADSEIIAVV